SPTAEPSISGTARDGSLLTASRGSWANSPTNYAYEWLRCDANAANCAPIPGANSRQYTIATGDVGRRLRVTVTASNAFGAGKSTSNATGVVQGTVIAPANTAPPSISGTPRTGTTLTAQNGTWNGTQPFTYAYAWRRCDAA